MERYFYPAVFHTEEIGYSVNVPDLDGCFSEGDTLEEAYTNTIEAVGLYLTDLQEQEQSLPTPSKFDRFARDKQDVIVLIEFDMLAYRKRHDTKAVKKTLTIPSWLNTIAEEKHINFSSVLQNALLDQLDLR